MGRQINHWAVPAHRNGEKTDTRQKLPGKNRPSPAQAKVRTLCAFDLPTNFEPG